MLESIIIIGIVGIALITSVRSIYKTLVVKTEGHSCSGNCFACPYKNSLKSEPTQKAAKH